MNTSSKVAIDTGSRDDGEDGSDGDGGALPKPSPADIADGSVASDADDAVMRGLGRAAAVTLAALLPTSDSARSDCEANRAGSQSFTCRRAI